MKIIGITTGDPTGIGPEVVRKALRHPRIRSLCKSLRIIGSLENVKGIRVGKESKEGGRIAYENLQRAIQLWRKGEIQALVTAPVSKSAIQKAGHRFVGHTEFLAEATGTLRYVMFFVEKRLRVALVTRHIPLKEVSRVLTLRLIESTLRISAESLQKYWKIPNPRIAVCGLNPHAGEGGLFGDEERQKILPAVRCIQKDFPGIEGPLSGDVLFHHALHGRYDAVVAMYHDQGLAPFKLLAYQTGVNVTLGLPFIRTSPDHGTAFDIAGRNKADPSSMIEAIRLAYELTWKT